MDQPVYELKNWQLQPYSDWMGVSGNVYGNPRFTEGYWINTSRIESVEADEEAFLMHTHNSVYLCRYDVRGRDAGEGFEELELLTKMGFDGEKAEAVIRAMERAVRDARKRHEERLLGSISVNDVNAVIIELSAEDEYYYRAVEIKQGTESLFSEARNIHVGKTRDSVYIGSAYGEADSLMTDIDFRYIPYPGNRAEFVEWTNDRGIVYVVNSGPMPIEIDTPCGRYVIPGGQCYPITPESELGRLQNPTPAETAEIWNTCIDEKGLQDFGTQR